MNICLYSALLRYTLVGGAAMMAFVAHHQYSRSMWHLRDVARVASVVPYAAAQRVRPILHAAAVRNYNYLMQVLAGHVYASRAVPVTRLRVWDGLAAALAVLLIYRVATMCCNRFTGIVSALLLASLPPAVWGHHAITMACALLNVECLLHALRRNTVPRWVLWSLSCLLLMACGVFAELFLLQTWFGALVLMWLAWFFLTRWFSTSEERTAPARRRHRERGTRYFRGDVGLARFVVMMVGVAVVTFMLVAVVLVFFTRFALTPSLVVQLFLWGCGLTLAIGLVLLFMPLYSRERAILLDRVLSTQVTQSIPTPDNVFRQLHVTSLANLLLAYAAAAVLFLPVLYLVHAGLNVFIRTWDGELLWQTLRTHGLARSTAFIGIPFIWLAGTASLYAVGVLSRARCVGAVGVVILSSMYLLQQRYAAMAAPFFIIAMAGFVVLLGEVAIYVWERVRVPNHVAPREVQLTTSV